MQLSVKTDPFPPAFLSLAPGVARAYAPSTGSFLLLSSQNRSSGCVCAHENSVGRARQRSSRTSTKERKKSGRRREIGSVRATTLLNRSNCGSYVALETVQLVNEPRQPSLPPSPPLSFLLLTRFSSPQLPPSRARAHPPNPSLIPLPPSSALPAMIRPRSLTLSFVLPFPLLVSDRLLTASYPHRATATAPSTATEPLKSLGEEDVGELPIARTFTPSTQLKSRRRHSSASPSSSVSSIESLLPVNAEEPPQIDETTALHPPPPPPSALPHHHFHTPRFDFPPGFFGPYDHYSSYLSPPPASFVPLPPSPGWFPIPPPPQPHSPFLAPSSPAFYPSPPLFPYSPPGSPVFPGHEFAPLTPALSPFLGGGLGGQQEGWILQGFGGTVTPPVPMSPTLLEEAQGETLCEMLDRGEAILSSGHVKYFDVQLVRSSPSPPLVSRASLIVLRAGVRLRRRRSRRGA